MNTQYGIMFKGRGPLKTDDAKLGEQALAMVKGESDAQFLCVDLGHSEPKAYFPRTSILSVEVLVMSPILVPKR